jgi:hypothetical protein
MDLILYCCLVVGSVSHQAPSLRSPEAIVYMGASAADLATTYRFLADGELFEVNPIGKRLGRRPALVVGLGAAADVAGLYLWQKHIARKWPRLGKVGLYVAAGFRVYLAVRNERHLAFVKGRR